VAINGVRSATGVAPLLPAAETGSAKPAAPQADDSLHGEWADHPPRRAVDSGLPPRSAQALRGAAQPEAPSGSTASLASKVLGQVAEGRVPLRGRHTQAVLHAALMVAARHVTALNKEAGRSPGE
jgi:hypothetical protein